MDLGLTGKRALITGATKGIGRAIAETLLAEGASVAICARTASEVEAAVKELSSAGVAIGQAVDAADADSLRAWVTASGDQLESYSTRVFDGASNSVASTSTSTTRPASRPESSTGGRRTSMST